MMRLSFNSKKARAATQQARRNVHSAVDQLADAAVPMFDRAATRAHDVVDTALTAADAAADWLGERTGEAQVLQRRLTARTTKYVAAHPLKTAALFFVAGVIFARLMR